jgi:hypothetical protein
MVDAVAAHQILDFEYHELLTCWAIHLLAKDIAVGPKVQPEG